MERDDVARIAKALGADRIVERPGSSARGGRGSMIIPDQEILDVMFLRLTEGKKILPQPEWPQDPAFVAYCLDHLRETEDELVARVDQAFHDLRVAAAEETPPNEIQEWMTEGLLTGLDVAQEKVREVIRGKKEERSAGS